MITLTITIDNTQTPDLNMDLTKLSDALKTSLETQDTLADLTVKLSADLDTANAKIAELEGSSTDAADQSTIDSFVKEVADETEKIKAIVEKYQSPASGGTTDSGSGTTPSGDGTGTTPATGTGDVPVGDGSTSDSGSTIPAEGSGVPPIGDTTTGDTTIPPTGDGSLPPAGDTTATTETGIGGNDAIPPSI